MSPQRPKTRSNDESQISLRQVAEQAGVSVTTASRVMSGSSHPVSEHTRHRVLSVADRLAFEPNRLARALVTARSQTVGVVVHDISDPYFGEIVKSLEDGLNAEDYRLFVASSDRDPDKELSYVRAFHSHQVDAIVFAASSLTAPDYIETLTTLARRFRANGGVIVTLSDHVLDGPRVHFDNRRAMSDMVEYLAVLGHRKVGYIGGPDDLEVARVREKAFLQAATAHGIETGPALMANGRFTFEGGSDAIAKIVDRAKPTAVLAANDLMAIGALRRLLASGVRVPDDISVAGFDDIPLAEYGPIPLTTMKVPTDRIGREAAALLLRILHGGDAPDVTLDGEIVERDSVARIGSGA
jgi:LacI family transcriptional regulator